MEKTLNLKGIIMKGRAIVIKKSNRNITTNKKRKREDVHEENIVEEIEEIKNDHDKVVGKKEKIKNKSENAVEKNKPRNKIENKNTSYSKNENLDESKKNLKNSDFKKFLNI